MRTVHGYLNAFRGVMYKQRRGDTQNDWLWLQSPAKRELREGHTHPHTHTLRQTLQHHGLRSKGKLVGT